MLPDQSRFVPTGRYETDVRLLEERFMRIPVFPPTNFWDQGTSPASSTTSATFAAMPMFTNQTFTFVKDENWTDVEVMFCGGLYVSANGDAAEYAINISGGGITAFNHTCGHRLVNTPSSHMDFTFINRLSLTSTLEQGRYTITPMWRRYNGAGTCSYDNHDTFSIRLLECLPARV